jgi:hypothetical protein
MDKVASFPPYVPEEIRHYVTRQLAQFSRFQGESQQKLRELRQRVEASNDDAGRVELRNETRRSEHWVSAAALVERVVSDSRLHDVLKLLEVEINDGKKCAKFLHAALNSNNDYNEFRDANRDALDVARQISVAADHLAELLKQFERVGIGGPLEFFSLRELLRVSDDIGVSVERQRKWDASRDLLLSSDIVDESGNDRLKILWALAPSPENLLRVMASAARRFEPYKVGSTGAALDSRERNRKWEYLRAFIYELFGHGFLLSNQRVSAAVAIMAAIVLDVGDVSDDDVRKAVKRVENYLIAEMGE